MCEGADATQSHKSERSLRFASMGCSSSLNKGVWSTEDIRGRVIQHGYGGYMLAVPTGFKEESSATGRCGARGAREGADGNDSVAVYISLSVYLHSKANGSHPFGEHFIWYSVDFFDLERNCARDHVFIDTSSQKLIVSSHVTGASAYNRMLPGSAASSNATWSAPRRFAYQVSSAHVERGIADGLQRR